MYINMLCCGFNMVAKPTLLPNNVNLEGQNTSPSPSADALRMPQLSVCVCVYDRVRCLNGMVQMATGYFIIFSAPCTSTSILISPREHENIVKIVACSRYKEQLLQKALKILSQNKAT